VGAMSRRYINVQAYKNMEKYVSCSIGEPIVTLLT